MAVIGAVAGRARCAAGRTSTAAAASTDTHDETCLGVVLHREEPAARNLVQLRHGHAPSCMHDRKTRPASTQNDEEPLKRGKPIASHPPERGEHGTVVAANHPRFAVRVVHAEKDGPLGSVPVVSLGPTEISTA